jgi:hypothetical protein
MERQKRFFKMQLLTAFFCSGTKTYCVKNKELFLLRQHPPASGFYPHAKPLLFLGFLWLNG